MKKTILGLFLAVTSVVVSAEVPYHSASDLIRNGRIVFQSQPQIGEYRLVLGSIKKVNNQWRAKQDLKSGALITRMTIELDELVSFNNARQSLMNDIKQAQNFSVIFDCTGHDCGSSNGWANEFLGVKQLYGLDNNQYYVVQAGLDAQGKETYVVWYLVQRGNGRIYLQQDVIHAGPDSVAGKNYAPEVWRERLIEKHYFVLPGFKVINGTPSVSSESVTLLHNLLSENARLVIRIVGHDYEQGSVTDRERRSLSYAQSVRDALVEKGVAANRLSIHGVGSLAPAGKVEKSRVEIVID